LEASANAFSRSAVIARLIYIDCSYHSSKSGLTPELTRRAHNAETIQVDE
jgi:hypothetical protein